MPPPNSASNRTPNLPSISPTSNHPQTPPLVNDTPHDENVSFIRARAFTSIPVLSEYRQRHRNPTSQDRPTMSRFRENRGDAARIRRGLDERIDELSRQPPVEVSRRIPIPVEVNRRIPIRRQRAEPANMSNFERTAWGYNEGLRRTEDENDRIQPFFYAVSDRNSLSARPPRHRPISRTSSSETFETSQVPTLSYDSPEDSPGDRPGARYRSLNSANLISRVSTVEALLQSARPQPRLARTRALENYLMDQDTNLHTEESNETERPAPGPSSRTYRYRPSTNTTRDAEHGWRNLYSSAHLGDTLLNDTLNYLDLLRDAKTSYDQLSALADTGFMSYEGIEWEDGDFITSTQNIAPPAISSWIRNGMVFVGCQRAANLCCPAQPQRIPNRDPVIVNGGSDGTWESTRDNTRVNVQTTSGRRYLANNTRDENWPVKVTIQTIDYTEMTLCGTMEAYNIPDKTSPTHDAHIVTFLEGEIIDFNKHTLETKNFKADVNVDSTYWRELQPFKNMSDTEIAKNLLSKKWLTEELAKGWILMRWKERCFITPTDSRQGLTISGFYYISLCRETGHIEGLYFDPGSSPYQQLSLKPESMKYTCPAYGFR
ncbi:hypothetical protein N7495_005826 [Penicillium taxi]|uniref:uncharacterized protein n=1 Tax=Penicillium taxi TaxID=168475 RepID=UPI0025455CA5|nr:uncharacterized protein N7495_005826 [Penicillium taxi]KAJ5894135.1 hypothetical protein N7495_005826 [Penicillium taxi]